MEKQLVSGRYKRNEKKGKVYESKNKNKHGSRAWYDQPIGHISAYMVSRLVEPKVKVMHCNRSEYSTLPIAQSQ